MGLASQGAPTRRSSSTNAVLIPTKILRVLATLAEALESSKTSWAITGSTSLALQGVEVEPNDIDVLTDETGAYMISSLFAKNIVSSVSFKRSPRYESHFGMLEIENVRIEIMGNLRVFRGGQWSQVMTPRTRKLEYVRVGNHPVPVVSLESQMDSGYLQERLQRTRT